MRVVRAEGAPLHQAPAESTPTVEELIDEDASGRRLTVTQVIIPPGGGMREHDHGEREALLVPLAGELVMTSGSERETITPGLVVLLDRGERVQLANQASEPFTMIMVFPPGSDPASVSRETSSSDGTRETPGEMQWTPAGALDQLDDDAAVHRDLAGHPVCLARSGGAVYAILDECSHGQVELSEGEVEDGYVECWLHGSRFDLTTGVPTGLPATRPVPVYPVRITEAGIEVALPVTTKGAAHG